LSETFYHFVTTNEDVAEMSKEITDFSMFWP